MVFPLSVIAVFVLGCPSTSNRFGEMSALANGTTDKGPAGHGFTEIYERFFYPLKNQPIRIFEIGIDHGDSLRLWQDYFPRATIHAIDIEDKSSLNTERILTGVADQGNRAQLEGFIRSSGGRYDIILDDGGHFMDLQQISLGFLFRHVRPGGFYIIEDVSTSLPRFGADFGVEADGGNSTLRMIRSFADTRMIESKYMTPEESRYLKKTIEYVVLFARNDRKNSMTCIIRKRPD